MGELLTLERELAGVMSLSDLTDSVLERVRRLLGASGAAVFSFDQPHAPVAQGGWLGPVLRDYTPDLFAEDPIQPYNCRLSPACFVNSGADFDWTALARSRVYADFYRPREIGSLCGVWPSGLEFGSRHMFGLLLVTPALSRRFREPGFDELRSLEAPFRAAARRIARYRALEQEADVLGQLLERRHGSFVLWDPGGRTACVSPRAQRELDALARGELEAAAQLARRELPGSRRSAPPSLLGRSQQLRTARGNVLRVELSWLAGLDQRPWLLGQLHDCSGAAAQLARLTRAQTTVLRLLVQGSSTAELARQLGISTETVKTHVKRILQQLGVSSRAKAVHLANQVWRES